MITLKKTTISYSCLLLLLWPEVSQGMGQNLTELSPELSPELSSELSSEQPPGTELYSAIFFAEYAPQTALEMVKRLPGFVLQEQDSEVRGLGTGAGNVLIDGSRPTTKSGGIGDALERIPASQVLRIDILRGTAGAADVAGQSVVANVVRRKQGGFRRWQMALEQGDDGRLSPVAQVSLSQPLGQWDSALKINAIKQRAPRDAQIRRYSSDGDLLQAQTETRPTTLTEVFFSGDARREFAEQTLIINARTGWSRYQPETTRPGFVGRLPDDSPDSLFSNTRDSQYYTTELGIDWLVPLQGDWQWRLVNLNNTKNWFFDTQSHSESYGEVPLVAGSQLRFDEHLTENVVRTSWSHHNADIDLSRFSLARQEYGIEVAYNNMHSGLKSNTVDQHGGTDTAITNSQTSAKVIEKRSEGFVNLNWQWRDFTLETAMAAEYSQITVAGASEADRSLFFWKPSLALTYDYNDDIQYRFNLRRSVGQLDFSDFAASADLVDGRAFSGNARLKPHRSVRAGLAFDWRFSDRGALGLEVYHQWRTDVLEQMILPSGNEALGNAGDATVKGLKLSANLPLDPFIDEGLLTVKADVLNSSFDDPLTGRSRALTKLDSPQVELDFRQDLLKSRISWGIGYQLYQESEEYFVNEYNHFRTQGRWNAFIESNRFGDLFGGLVDGLFDGVKVRLAAKNLGDEQQSRNRRVYANGRNGQLLWRQSSERNRGPVVSLTFSGSL